MKHFLTRHQYIHFLFCSLLLPCLDVLLIIFNTLGLGTLNADCPLLNSVDWFVSMPFVAVDFLLFVLEFLAVLGIVNFIFFSIIVNSRVLANLGFKTVLLSTVVISCVSYFILCIPTFEPGMDWFVYFMELSLLFSVLPSVIAVCIRYAIWKTQQRHKK